MDYKAVCTKAIGGQILLLELLYQGWFSLGHKHTLKHKRTGEQGRIPFFWGGGGGEGGQAKNAKIPTQAAAT